MAASWFTGGLFLAALLPVVRLVLMCVCGALAARKGILDAKGRRTVNLVVFWIFTPALIFVTLGGIFSFTNLKRLWFIPVNILLSYPIGLTAGCILCHVLRCPARLRTHVILAVAMGNTGNMPFLFVMALCADARTPFPAALGSNCQTVGYGYVALGCWVAAIFQFALAFSLLKPNSDHPGPLVADRSGELPQTSPAAAGTLTPASGAAGALTSSGTAAPSGQLQLASLESSEARRNALPINGRPADAAERQQGAELPIGNVVPEDDQWVAVVREGEIAHYDAASPLPQTRSHEPLFVGNASSEQRAQHDVMLHDRGAESHANDEPMTGSSGTSSSGSPFSDVKVPLPTKQQQSLQRDGHLSPSASPEHSPRGLFRWLRGGGGAEKNYGSIAETLGKPKTDTKTADIKAPQQAAEQPGWSHQWKIWGVQMRRNVVREFHEFDWGSFHTPPLVGCYIAFFVGAIPAIRNLFFGNSRALGFITDTLDTLGTAMIPSAMLVIGAVLQNGPGGKAIVPYRILAGVVVTRLFIIPILGASIVYGLAKQGAFYVPDPLYFFLLLLMYLMPTSYNLQTMATMHKNGEREMGAMIFWVYICGMFTMPFFIMYFLHMSTVYA